MGEHAIEHLPVAPSLRDRTGLTIVANLNGDIRPTRPWRPSKIRIGDRVRGYTPGSSGPARRRRCRWVYGRGSASVRRLASCLPAGQARHGSSLRIQGDRSWGVPASSAALTLRPWSSRSLSPTSGWPKRSPGPRVWSWRGAGCRADTGRGSMSDAWGWSYDREAAL